MSAARRTDPETGYSVIANNETVAGRYTIRSLLGVGAFGAVYLAEDRSTREIALKEFHAPDGALDDEAAQRYQLEVEAMLSVRGHPLVPDLIEHFAWGGTRFIAMAHVAGQGLDGLVEADPPAYSLVDALGWLYGISHVLDRLHGKQLVHQDVKPANIKINAHGLPVLLDFGGARYYAGDKQDDSALYGADGYIAPEMQNIAATLDHRTDIFSLGCLAYVLLTGHELTPEQTTGLDNLEPPSVRAVRRFGAVRLVADGVDRVAKRCLFHHSGLRYASLDEFRADVAGMLRRLPGGRSQLARLHQVLGMAAEAAGGEGPRLAVSPDAVHLGPVAPDRGHVAARLDLTRGDGPVPEGRARTTAPWLSIPEPDFDRRKPSVDLQAELSSDLYEDVWNETHVVLRTETETLVVPCGLFLTGAVSDYGPGGKPLPLMTGTARWARTPSNSTSLHDPNWARSGGKGGQPGATGCRICDDPLDSPTVPCSRCERFRMHYLAGSEALEKGDGRQAAGRFREALKEFPDDVGSLRGLGQALMAQGQTDEARATLTRALEADPTDLLSHFALAELLDRVRMEHEALTHYGLAAQLGHAAAAKRLERVPESARRAALGLRSASDADRDREALILRGVAFGATGLLVGLAAAAVSAAVQVVAGGSQGTVGPIAAHLLGGGLLVGLLAAALTGCENVVAKTPLSQPAMVQSGIRGGLLGLASGLLAGVLAHLTGGAAASAFTGLLSGLALSIALTMGEGRRPRGWHGALLPAAGAVAAVLSPFPALLVPVGICLGVAASEFLRHLRTAGR